MAIAEVEIMEFYVSLYQLIAVLEELKLGLHQLAGWAFRLSPRDAQSNRELLNQCLQMTREPEIRIVGKVNYDKVLLRRTVFLFKALEVSHRRLLLLAGGVEAGLGESPIGAVSIYQHLGQASRHFGVLLEILTEKGVVPVTLTVKPGMKVRDLHLIRERKERFRKTILSLLEKIREHYDYDQELIEKVIVIRKDLLGMGRVLKSRASAKSFLSYTPFWINPTGVFNEFHPLRGKAFFAFI